MLIRTPRRRTILASSAFDISIWLQPSYNRTGCRRNSLVCGGDIVQRMPLIRYEVKSSRYDFIIENRKITAMNKIIIEQADLQTDIPLKFTLTKPLRSIRLMVLS
eukprot:scaffold13088_cov56-Phaeocystis_antarctica.AAC.3